MGGLFRVEAGLVGVYCERCGVEARGGFRVLGIGFGVEGAEASGWREVADIVCWGLGFRVQGFGFRVSGLGFRFELEVL